ncbi:MAG: hypothetical protein HYY85_20280, partial [Deltaproteobacteria bacterium]|nr:hypothetical protein [Deltaproteobacteria bacterium]
MGTRLETRRWGVAILAVLLLLALAPRESAGAAFDDIAVGTPAPEFKLKDYSEQEAEVALSSFKGEK